MYAFRYSPSTSTWLYSPSSPCSSSASWKQAVPKNWAILIPIFLLNWLAILIERGGALTVSVWGGWCFQGRFGGMFVLGEAHWPPRMGQFPKAGADLSLPPRNVPTLLLSQPQGLLWVSYAPLHVRPNLITGDKVLQSRPLKVLYKDAALK